MKAAGRIGCIGLSSHNPQVAQAAVGSGLIDVLMFSVNPCYDLQPASEDVEELWAEKNYEKDLSTWTHSARPSMRAARGREWASP